MIFSGPIPASTMTCTWLAANYIVMKIHRSRFVAVQARPIAGECNEVPQTPHPCGRGSIWCGLSLHSDFRELAASIRIYHCHVAHRARHLSTLRTKLEAYLKETADPRREGRDPWQQYPYRQTTGFGASFNSTLSEAARDAAADQARHKPE